MDLQGIAGGWGWEAVSVHTTLSTLAAGGFRGEQRELVKPTQCLLSHCFPSSTFTKKHFCIDYPRPHAILSMLKKKQDKFALSNSTGIINCDRYDQIVLLKDYTNLHYTCNVCLSMTFLTQFIRHFDLASLIGRT